MQDIDGRNELTTNSLISLHWSSKHDGNYDKHSVFISGLMLPRAILPLADSVLVMTTGSDSIWRYWDTNNDGVADRRELVREGRRSDAVPWEFLRAAVTRGHGRRGRARPGAPEAVDEVRATWPRCSPSRASAAPRCSWCPRPRRRRDAAARGRSIIARWLHGLATDATVRAAVVHAHPRRRRPVAGRPGVPPRRGERRAGRRRHAPASRGRRALRRRAGRVDSRQWRRVAAARRGARPLAGVRRHRRADARPGVQGRPAARPGHGSRAAASRSRATSSPRRWRPESRRWSRAAADEAAERAGSAWRRRPGRAALLGDDDLRRQLARAGRGDGPRGPRVAGLRARAGARRRARASGRRRATSRSASTGSA